MGVTLQLKCIVETKLIRISYYCINCSFPINSYLKQLYISKKMEYLVGVICVGVVCVLQHLKELAQTTNRWLWVISITMLLKIVIPKNKAVLILLILYALLCGPW